VSSPKSFQSHYGLTTWNADGSYRFAGKDICYDVLEEE
jgi:hypothetical protein